MRNSARWATVAVALVVAGIAVRAALYFPAAAFPIDSDGVLAGLCGLAVRAGERPAFFPGGYRLGAASCYLTAAYFSIVGVSRIALASTGLTWGALYLVASAALARAALSARAACVAVALAAFPSAAFLTVTYVPWGYGEIAASCAATLWLAVLWRRRSSPWIAAAFGCSVGVGAWMSLQTAMVAIPALWWIVARRRPDSVREWFPAIAAASVGAVPWLIANLGSGFPSLHQNWVAVPVSESATVLANASWFVRTSLAQLFVYGGPLVIWTSLTAGIVLAAFGFVASLRADDCRRGAKPSARDVAWLAGGVFATAFALDIFSAAGSVRGWTVRYAAPVYPVATLVIALGIDWIRTRAGRACAAATLALLLLPNLALYDLPGTSGRAALRSQLLDDMATLSIVRKRGVAVLYGAYFDVYHYNFDARGVAAIPSVAALDYLGYGASLDHRAVHWAVLLPAGVPEPSSLARAGVRAYRFGGTCLYVAPRSSDAAALLTVLRSSRVAAASP